MASVLARMARLEAYYARRHETTMAEMELIRKEKEELHGEVLLFERHCKKLCLENFVSTDRKLGMSNAP
ncbi:hypothetical protein K7X08_023210 [Anisodus acutangulus]|uniref:Uncharacterized protein n=1 Tax=Anisodus acutangulus TaxID=402998 RepID=A0A9Q1LHH7_9SOLA|nr:hypothetical protein K7X08_023210 [Anisodus acutangulus]